MRTKGIQDQDVEALASLGLRVLQAKVYLALVKLGNATIKEISKTVHVARQDLYRITSELQEMGLVEKMITMPTQFKAVELTDGISVLYRGIHEKEEESRKRIIELVQRYKNTTIKDKLQQDDTQFGLVSEKLAVRLKKKRLANLQRNFDLIGSWKNPHNVLFVAFEEISEALQRGVEIRAIIDKPEKEELLSDIISNLKKYPKFKLKYLLNSPEALISVFDKKTAWVCTSVNPGQDSCPTLLTNNPCFLSIFHDYFEILWLVALEMAIK